MDPYQWQQIAGDDRADDVNQDVSNQSIATAPDRRGEPHRPSIVADQGSLNNDNDNSYLS